MILVFFFNRYAITLAISTNCRDRPRLGLWGRAEFFREWVARVARAAPSGQWRVGAPAVLRVVKGRALRAHAPRTHLVAQKIVAACRDHLTTLALLLATLALSF